MEHHDVLIVGAGLSGVGAACHLQKRCPDRGYAIFEARDAIGGTWDLFRYPGVRSDSDMYTLGYAFRPWTEAKAIADGPSILAYVRDTAAKYGVERHIRFGRKVVAAAWDSSRSLWTVDYEEGASRRRGRATCGFLYMCAGYYSYAGGHRPSWAGEADFAGRLVHPQAWPADLDYAGKRVVVIGSGATAVTLAPEMAKTAAHVVMLQRSPTYVVSAPAEDAFANRLRRFMPAALAYALVRWRNVLGQLWFYRLTRKRPEAAKAALLSMVRKELGPDYDVETHFTPRYNPWDQRLCLVPDADLFAALREGRAEVVTGQIARFERAGVRLQSGELVEADLIVAATGLELEVLGGLEVSVDGVKIDFAKTFSYKAMMFSGVPNLASTFGYTNASWTLKADLTAEYVCRLLNHMRRRGLSECRANPPAPETPSEPWLTFSSGYVVRAMSRFPKQGPAPPWRVHQNYALDLIALRYGALDDGVMRFSRPASTAAEALRTAAA